MLSHSANPETRFLFVRHAQTIWNKEHRYAGSSEVPLAPEAEAQIEVITQRLLKEPITSLFCSPLTRCQKTIQPTAEALHLTPMIREDLKERYLGNWEGMRPEDLPIDHRGYHFPDSAYNGTYRIPHAETLEALEERVRSVLSDIEDKHSGETILIATHAGVIWSLLSRIVSNTPEKVEWPSNCSLYTIVTYRNGYRLQAIEPGL